MTSNYTNMERTMADKMTQNDWIKKLYGSEENLWKHNYAFIDAQASGIRRQFNPASYIAVARAFAEGRMKHKEETPPFSLAAYEVVGNVLYVEFNKVKTLEDRATVFHECTHAVNDLSGPGILTVLTDEASAFLAETIFLKTIGGMVPRRNGTDPEWSNMYTQADILAKKFFLYNGTPKDLVRADYADLRKAVGKIYDAGNTAPEMQLPEKYRGAN